MLYRTNGKFYVCSKFSAVVFYVMLRTLHTTLRYGSTSTAATVCYDTLQFLTLRESGKQALYSQCICIKQLHYLTWNSLDAEPQNKSSKHLLQVQQDFPRSSTWWPRKHQLFLSFTHIQGAMSKSLGQPQ